MCETWFHYGNFFSTHEALFPCRLLFFIANCTARSDGGRFDVQIPALKFCTLMQSRLFTGLSHTSALQECCDIKPDYERNGMRHAISSWAHVCTTAMTVHVTFPCMYLFAFSIHVQVYNTNNTRVTRTG